MKLRAWIALLLLLLGLPRHAAAEICGAAGSACAVPLGAYRVALPTPDSAGPRPVLLYLHGGGGSATEILTRGDIAPEFTAHGYVVIIPDGMMREPPLRTGWYFRPNTEHKRNELAFLRQVLDDASTRWRIDRTRVLLAGESIGGSLTWYLACQAPGEFAAFAPVAGGFWNPLPTECAAPVKLLHTHGWRDATVPLEGRRIRDIAVQGDIFAGLAVWRAVNRCPNQPPDITATGTMGWHRVWSGCATGSWLELVLHDRGHEVPDWWPPMARTWFERVVPR